MYRACRHIKPGGERCKSPAMRGHAFCYFHARIHSITKLGLNDEFELPIPEDSAAVQESLGKVFQAILSSRIDAKKTSQLLWALQIASHNILRKPKKDPVTVSSMTHRNGVELAPEYHVCDPIRECYKCPRANTCDRYFDFDALVGREKDKDDEDDDEEESSDSGVDEESAETGEVKSPDSDSAEEDSDEDDDGYLYPTEAEIREHDRLLSGESSKKQAKEDDEEDAASLLGTLKVFHQLKYTLEEDD